MKLQYNFYNKYRENHYGDYATLINYMNTSFAIYDSTFSMVHWIFAAHYFMNAVRMEKFISAKDPNTDQLKMQILFWSLLALNALTPFS